MNARTASPKSPVTPELPPVTDSLPTVVTPAVEVVGNAPTSTVSLLIVDEATRQETEHEAAKAVSDYGFYGIKQSKARTEMFEVMLKLRRQYPATPEVRAILGEDAADLRGSTPEYQAAIAKVWAEAQQNLVTRLRREIGTEAAKLGAEGVISKLRTNLSNDIRKEVEEIARGQKNPQLFLLGHGFARSTQLPKGQLIVEGAKIVTDEATGGPAVLLPAPAKKADGAPNEASDQAKPGETAGALEAALAASLGESLANLQGRINVGIGALRGAFLADPPKKGLTGPVKALAPADLVNILANVTQVWFEVLATAGESLPEEERRTVAENVRQAAQATLYRIAKGATAPKVETPKGTPIATPGEVKAAK